MQPTFIDAMQAYAQAKHSTSAATLYLGGIIYDDEVAQGIALHVPLKSLNRHGLIAGATGTGKTKTIQMLTEQLSQRGIPTLLMDMKGDLSGLAMPGMASDALMARQKQLQLAFHPQAYPVELLALGDSPGVRIRSTLVMLGPLLFAKMLDLNETQSAMLSILFQYAQDQQISLLDLADFKRLLVDAQGAGKQAIESSYGGIASSSMKAILRAVVELESQGGAALFGEPAFAMEDLLRENEQGYGVSSILRLMNLNDQPKLFSTLMLGLLNQIYTHFPEIGDPEQPKLVIFIDEAHLIFHHASKALLERLEHMVKLIRSKGVGLIFCTQSPNDIPEAVLGQLGLKIQHALRAFTAKDRKAIQLVAQNFPETPYYDVAYWLTSLGIGKALVSALDAEGQPMPLVIAMFRSPESRMGPLSEAEQAELIARSSLVKKYEHSIAHSRPEEPRPVPTPSPQASINSRSGLEAWSKNTLFRQLVRMIVKNLMQLLISAFRVSGSRRKK
jgi:DNA helicase HerA-like ATPase